MRTELRSKHVEDSNKRIIEENVCQIGHLPESPVLSLVLLKF